MGQALGLSRKASLRALPQHIIDRPTPYGHIAEEEFKDIAQEEFFRRRHIKNLDIGIETVKPVLQFPGKALKLGYHGQTVLIARNGHKIWGFDCCLRF